MARRLAQEVETEFDLHAPVPPSRLVYVEIPSFVRVH